MRYLVVRKRYSIIADEKDDVDLGAASMVEVRKYLEAGIASPDTSSRSEYLLLTCTFLKKSGN